VAQGVGPEFKPQYCKKKKKKKRSRQPGEGSKAFLQYTFHMSFRICVLYLFHRQRNGFRETMIKQDRTEPGPEPINPNSKVLAPFMWGSANKLAFWMLQRLKPSAAWWRDRAQRRRAGGAKSSKASWGRGRASRRQKEAKPRSRCTTGLGLTHGARASRGPKL
jgi:hypothetical protein